MRYPNGCELVVLYLVSGNRKIFSVGVYAVDIENDLWRLLSEWITPILSAELLAAASARAETRNEVSAAIPKSFSLSPRKTP